MATTSTKAITSNVRSLKQQAEQIRLAKRGNVPAERQGAGFFATLGFASADLVNGFATVGDAYTIRRAERE